MTTYSIHLSTQSDRIVNDVYRSQTTVRGEIKEKQVKTTEMEAGRKQAATHRTLKNLSRRMWMA